MADENELDGCAADFTEQPTSDDEIAALLAPESRDRTEAEEQARREASGDAV